MLSATSQTVDRPSTADRGSSRISAAPTCSQCTQFRKGICQLKAVAGWGDSSKVSTDRPVCHFAELYPF